MRFLAAVAVLALLTMSSWAFAEEKAGEKTADAPAAPANEWHGTVGCAKCDFVDRTNSEECLPAVKTFDGAYLLKPAPAAPPAVKEFLVRIQNKEMIGDYLIKGETTEADGKKWVMVTSMVAKPLPKATATLATTRKKSGGTAGGAGADQGGAGGGTDEGGGGGGGKRGGRRHKHNDGGGEGGGGEEQ